MPPPSPPIPPPSDRFRPVDPRIWRACAGSSVQIPAVNSRVYYFPQGHLEQTSASSVPQSVNLLSASVSRPFVACYVSAVQLLADPVTDEVFAKLLLFPVADSSSSCSTLNVSSVSRAESSAAVRGDDEEEEDKVEAFAKVLTASDAHNGGGFSVPRFCADAIFPRLNFQANPPVQILTVMDIHGTQWDFRHIYRGTPRRHLLTTGWSKFVNSKMLIAGDSVVFMRNKAGEMFIGVRRAMKFGGGGKFAEWGEQIGCEGGVDLKLKENDRVFSRAARGKVSLEAVTEAIEKAYQGLPFEVVYYPRAGLHSDFVVRAEVAEGAFNVYWAPGVRVKMAIETEDLSRITWFQGTVESVVHTDCGPWQGSPWRMLQIRWDEPEVLQNSQRVSPWQVEYISTAPEVHGAFPPPKRFRCPELYGFPTDGDGDLFFPMSGLTNSTMGNINQPLLNYRTFPAGMQGARQNPFYDFSFSNYLSDNPPQMCNDNVFNNKTAPRLNTVSTELNIGSSLSENLSPESQNSVHTFGAEPVHNQGCNSTRVGIISFQLFGKTIHMNQPVENGYDDASCMEDCASKADNENNMMDPVSTRSDLESQQDGWPVPKDLTC